MSDEMEIAVWWFGICLIAGLIVYLTWLRDRRQERRHHSRKDDT